MSKSIVPLSAGIVLTLKETASYVGGVNLDTVISAAIWSFARQDRVVQATILREFWYSGIMTREVKTKKSLLRRVYELGKRLYAQVCPSAPR